VRVRANRHRPDRQRRPGAGQDDGKNVTMVSQVSTTITEVSDNAQHATESASVTSGI